MLTDGYNRKIDYMRISVTDRCNLKCVYCMPADGVEQKLPSQILTFEEIAAVAQLAARIGITKIKITGGEPLLRRNLPRLLSLLFSIKELEDISLTTNGVLLERYAKELKETGLKKINISIDTLIDSKFERISRFACLGQVLKGIDAALKYGFLVKLNVVVLKAVNDDEILDFARFAAEKNVVLRFIELMPVIRAFGAGEDPFVSCAEIKQGLESLGQLKPVTAKLGNGPAQYYKIEEASLTVGFISPISSRFCFDCNRLRLSADGLIMPCLNSKEGVDLRTPLRQNNKDEILVLLKKAAHLKPQEHNMGIAFCGKSPMVQIGG